MKANELTSRDLMVGDWLMFNDKPCQVKGLHSDDSAFLVGYKSPYFLIDAEPILITKELLEKNGFEKEGVIELYNLYAGIDHRVTIHDDKEYMNSNNEWYVHVDSEDYSTIAGCELTYVHELQHLLRVCKINFEFNI